MKKIDKIIVKSAIIIASLATIFGFVKDYVLTMQILGGILLAGYFFFLIFHLCLCMPSFAVGCVLAQIYENTYKKIFEKSEIIANTTRFIFVLVGIIGVHLLWIYLGSSIFLQNPNFLECWEWCSVLAE